MAAKVARHSPVYSGLLGVMKTEKRLKAFLESQDEGVPEMELLQRAITQAQEQPLLLTPTEAFDLMRDQRIKRQLLYTLSDMALCGLPYDCPFDEKEQRYITHMERRVRMFNGELRVVMVALDPNVPLPYGMNDRKMFMAICTLAVLQQTSKITLPQTLDFFTTFLNRKTDGGANYIDFLASLERLSKFMILMEYSDGVKKLGGKQGIVQAYYLPTNPRLKQPRKTVGASLTPLWKADGDTGQLLLEDSFVNEVLDAAYPLPANYMDPFMSDKPLAWDLAQFLPRRCSNAASVSAITLPSLQAQLGSRDSNPYRFKEKINHILQDIRKQWDDTVGRKQCCPAYIHDDALIVGPVKPGNELVPRIEKVQSKIMGAVPNLMQPSTILPGFEDLF